MAPEGTTNPRRGIRSIGLHSLATVDSLRQNIHRPAGQQERATIIQRRRSLISETACRLRVCPARSDVCSAKWRNKVGTPVFHDAVSSNFELRFCVGRPIEYNPLR